MTTENGLAQAQDGPPTGRFKVGGFDLPLPGWSVSCLAALLVIGAAVIGYDKYLEEPVKRLLGSSERMAQEQEYRNHFDEDPLSEEEIFNDDRGKLTIAYFPSDSCLLVKRNDRAQWVLHPKGSPPPPAELGTEVVAVTSAGMVPAASREQCPRNGVCLEKHSGEFDSWNGETTGCWIKVWRRWEDGCKHYQWYNECEGNWDNRKFWTCCVH